MSSPAAPNPAVPDAICKASGRSDFAPRLEALARYRILDTPAEPVFDALTRLAASICDTPMALLCFWDAQRQWVKSKVGIDIDQLPLGSGLFPPAADQRAVVVVPDTLKDARFADHPAVNSAPHVRFYAGASLITPEGHVLGTLCALGQKPKRLGRQKIEALCALAQETMIQLELRREQLELNSIAARPESVLATAGEGIYALDTQGRATFVNSAAAEMLGYEPRELQGLPLHDLIHYAHADGAPYALTDCRIQASLRDGQTHRADGEVFWRKDGAALPVSWISTPMIEAGEVVGVTVVFHDVTRFKGVLRVLRASEAQLRLVTDALPALISYVNTEHRYVFSNRAYQAWFGLSREQVVGKHVAEVLGDDAYPLISAYVERALQGQRLSFEAQVPFKRGPTRYIHATYVPDYDDRGEVKGYTELTEEITARKRSEEARDRFFTLPLHLLCIIGMDGCFKNVNPAFENTLGYAQGELLGQLFLDLIHPDDRKVTLEEFEKLKEGSSINYMENRYRCKDGTYRWLAWAAHPDIKEQQVYAMALDIGERKQAQQALQHSETRYRSLVTATTSIVWIAAPDGSINNEVPSWQAFIGQTFREYQGLGWLNAVHPYDRQHMADIWRRAVVDRTPVEIEDRLRHRDGQYRHMLVRGVPIFEADGHLREWIGTCTDITERKDVEARLSHLANYDGLTNLPNRVLLMDRLSQVLAQVPRHERLVAVLFVDVDRFKTVNDSLGHDVGDLLLQAIAGRLVGCVRDSDTVARLGGDEFIVMLSEISRATNADIIAQKLVDALSRPFEVENHQVIVGASIGISLYPKDGVDAKTLVKHADNAMYQAKERGRNQYRQYEPAVIAQTARRLALGSNLRHALIQNEFELTYQPQIDLGGGRIIAAAMFLRWRRPNQTRLISPSEFIREAEAQDVIEPASEWMLHAVCTQRRAWQEQGLTFLRVAIAMTKSQLHQLNVPEMLSRILDETGLVPAGLELELTESLVRGTEMEPLLRALTTLGVGITITDFGATYSPLSDLQRFSIKKLKISRSFMRGIPGDANNEAVVAAVTGMAHSLGLKVVADGVLMLEQLEFLRTLGCDWAQGYLLGKPLSAEALTQVLLAEEAADAPVCAARFYPNKSS